MTDTYCVCVCCVQNARLAECERLLLAVDVGLWCGDSSAALQAVVSCYGLLAPLMYHQLVWEPMMQVSRTPRTSTYSGVYAN